MGILMRQLFIPPAIFITTVVGEVNGVHVNVAGRKILWSPTCSWWFGYRYRPRWAQVE